MKKIIILSISLILFYSCSRKEDYVDEYSEEIINSTVNPEEEFPGDKLNTSSDVITKPFGHVSMGLRFDPDPFATLSFGSGNSFFRLPWATGNASTAARDGLGPLFNANACAVCHIEDGRGFLPREVGDDAGGLLVRLSSPGKNPHGGPKPVQGLGGQLNNNSFIVKPEGDVSISYTEEEKEFPDGEKYYLRTPIYTFTQYLGDVLYSPRVGPHLIGLGLLDAIDDEDILANADRFDVDNDTISGRPNYVYNRFNGDYNALGKFGWKSNEPTLRQQVAGAFMGDMGLTTKHFPDGTGNPEEVSDNILDKVVLYTGNLAVPKRRNFRSKRVINGKKLFNDVGCVKCHVAHFTTGNKSDFNNLKNQSIYPYTDLLLHDLGPGLADNRPDFLAEGNEWRTPPLWGIGLFYIHSPKVELLHDGRARSVKEAIMWHGGEAKPVVRKFSNLSKDERNQLIEFVNSL